MYDTFMMVQSNNHPSGIPECTQYVRYFGSHLETIRRCVNKARTEYIWVISDVCLYRSFDFNYRPAPWEAKQIHCWASGDQEQGDTFLINVEEFKKQSDIERLEYYQDVQYHHPGVERYSTEVQHYTGDVVTAIKGTEFKSPYVLFKDGQDDDHTYNGFNPSLWKERAICALNTSGSAVLVPDACREQISKQLYQYHLILRETDKRYPEKPQDIVYISYNEKEAILNWENLREHCRSDDRLHHVQGVKGMVNALKEAATASRTSWFYAVFPKTVVHPDFDFSFEPDYMAEQKHYIFEAYNPILDYSYGHGAVVMYNKDLVLNCTEYGVDFTTSFPVQSVPILSCINNPATPYEAYRTSFREAIKLQSIDSIEAKYRLHLWLTASNTDLGEFSVSGAHDGLEFMKEHSAMDTYSWEFMEQLFNSKYGED